MIWVLNPFPMPGDLNLDLFNPLEGELTIIGAIAMIHLPVTAFIGFSTEEMGQLYAYQGEEVGAHRFSDIDPDDLEEFLGLRLNLLEHLQYF